MGGVADLTLNTLLEDLRAKGVNLRIEEERILVRAPRNIVTQEIRDALTRRRSEILELLTLQAGWPGECLQSEQRFGSWHARLFPLIGKAVDTPQGPGKLFNVLSSSAGARAGVILDITPGRVTLMDARMVKPDRRGSN